MFVYAQIDLNTNIVLGVSNLSGEVTRGNLIPLQEYDTSLIGKTYNPETGTFS